MNNNITRKKAIFVLFLFSLLIISGCDNVVARNSYTGCEDTDGWNYEEQGTITLIHPTRNNQIRVDYCRDEDRLLEHNCGRRYGSPIMFNRIISCSREFGENYMCSEGACINEDEIKQCGDEITENTILSNDLLNCEGNGLIINANDITLDCNYHTINSDISGELWSRRSGVLINEASNTILKNCNITDFNYGILVREGNNNTIWNNYLLRNFDNGEEWLWENRDYYNNWNITNRGNFWDDFEDNSGYPEYYNVSMYGDDWHPIPIIRNECGGDVECNCGDIIVEDYTMNSDLENCGDYGLIMGANNINLDCDNHFITGTNYGRNMFDGIKQGIYLNNKEGITIQNCNINQFESGIFLKSSYENHLLNNNLVNNTNGTVLSRSSNNIIEGNSFSESFKGFILSNSSNNYFTNNRIENGDLGLYLVRSSYYNSIWNNSFINNRVNAYELLINPYPRNFQPPNDWNTTDLGNYWDDFENNVGYPDYYKVGGHRIRADTGNIDWHPQEE